jgi:hypothetical protein
VAQEAEEASSKAPDAITWLVALLCGALGWLLAKLDFIQKLPSSGRYAFLFAVGLIALSILYGVFYRFQLTAAKQLRRKVDQLKKLLPVDQAAVKAEYESEQAALDAANNKLGKLHYFTMFLLLLIVGATLRCVYVAMFDVPPAAHEVKKDLSNHYVLINVPVHVGGKLSHSHTFLLNQQTGEAWLMSCMGGKTVEFRRVRRLRLDGTPEEDTSAGQGVEVSAAGREPARTIH